MEGNGGQKQRWDRRKERKRLGQKPSWMAGGKMERGKFIIKMVAEGRKGQGHYPDRGQEEG